MNDSQSTRRPTSMLFALAAVVIVLAGLKAGQTVLVPFLLAVFIATIASTPIQWLAKHRVPTWLAVTIVLVVLIVAVTGLGLVVLQTVRELNAERGVYIERLVAMRDGVIAGLQGLGVPIAEDWASQLLDPAKAFGLAGDVVQRVASLVASGFLVLLTVIFILAEATEWPKKLKTFLSDRDMEIVWINQFGSTLNRYIAIKTSTSLLTGTLVTIFLSIVGVDFAILWGLLAFLLNYIPNIGSFIAATPAVLISLVQLGYGSAFIVLVGYVVINVGIGAGIEPRFLGRTLGISTLIVFLSLIFWGWMFGPIGMLLSVPLTMTAKIAFGTSQSTEWIAHLLEPGVPRNNQIKADK